MDTTKQVLFISNFEYPVVDYNMMSCYTKVNTQFDVNEIAKASVFIIDSLL